VRKLDTGDRRSERVKLAKSALRPVFVIIPEVAGKASSRRKTTARWKEKRGESEQNDGSSVRTAP
jgi:hypothetical protein